MSIAWKDLSYLNEIVDETEPGLLWNILFHLVLPMYNPER